MKSVLSDAKRHHAEADNERMREALHLIADLCAASHHEMCRNIGKIARAALVSASPENQSLRNPAQTTEGEAP